MNMRSIEKRIKDLSILGPNQYLECIVTSIGEVDNKCIAELLIKWWLHFSRGINNSSNRVNKHIVLVRKHIVGKKSEEA